MPQFFYKDKLNINQIFTIEDEARHLLTVRRIKIDDCVHVRDSAGQLFDSKIIEITTDSIILKTENQIENNQNIADITLGLCLLKNKNFDLAIQKAVEIGISEIVPIISERTIVKIKDKNDSKIERYRKIASEASKQSYRSNIPIIKDTIDLNNFLTNYSDFSKIIAVTQNHSQSINEAVKSMKNQKIVVLIGPEGGFSDKEVKNALQNDWKAVHYGFSVMRAETAAIVIPAIIINEVLEKKNAVL